MRWGLIAAAVAVTSLPAGAQPGTVDRSFWLGLVKSGYAVPSGRSAIDVLIEANQLLASPDPVLRDEVAYGAAERWIRDGKLAPPDLRRLQELWLSNTADGLGTADDDRVFKRSFSALSLSLIAARDLTEPFLEAAEVQAFFDAMLAYFDRETDVRGFDPERGWMHTVAHTSDTLKFLARNPKLDRGADVRLLAAVQRKIERIPAVLMWGENDRMALALQSAVRRADADTAVLEEWLEHWVGAHKALWADGPRVNPAVFARVENAKQVLRSLHSALAMESKPTPNGDSARQAIVLALARMR
jgi:hypothetical protein